MSVRCRGWISFAVAAILSLAIVPAAHAAFGFQDLLRDKRGSVAGSALDRRGGETPWIWAVAARASMSFAAG